MQRRKFTVVPTFAIAALAVLAFTACAAEPAAESDEAVATESQSEEATTESTGGSGTVELTVNDVTYTSELASCSLQGQVDALFHGVALDAAGSEVGYLSGDFTNLTDVPTGEVRIGFGATDQFESTDEFIALGDAVGHIVVTDASDTNLWIMGSAWDHDGTATSGSMLKVEC